MKKLILLLALCTSLSALNRLQFNDIMLGTTLRQVVDCYGDPYSVHEASCGIVFEYIERITMNNSLVYENHYYLTFVNDRVVSKCFNEEGRPPYDEMYQMDPNYPNFP